ncbi:MAG: NuoI/complex I 23 kDa subunit family protein, partial [Gemmataceae bacterium]
DEKDVVWMKPPTIGLLEQLYVPAILQGLGTTFQHSVSALFGKGQITQQFPEVEPALPANYRGVHRLNRDEKDRVKCVACYMCSTACPAHCIDIVAAPAPADWQKDGREKYPETFVIDELRCIYCGMCEQACPVDAIELTTLYDLTGMSREEMMFDKEKLLSVFDETAKPGAKFYNPVRTKGGRLGVASELAESGLTSSSTAQS